MCFYKKGSTKVDFINFGFQWHKYPVSKNVRHNFCTSNILQYLALGRAIVAEPKSSLREALVLRTIAAGHWLQSKNCGFLYFVSQNVSPLVSVNKNRYQIFLQNQNKSQSKTLDSTLVLTWQRLYKTFLFYFFYYN